MSDKTKLGKYLKLLILKKNIFSAKPSLHDHAAAEGEQQKSQFGRKLRGEPPAPKPRRRVDEGAGQAAAAGDGAPGRRVPPGHHVRASGQNRSV